MIQSPLYLCPMNTVYLVAGCLLIVVGAAAMPGPAPETAICGEV